MNCDEARRDLDLYVDGILADEARADLAAHLAACEPCREEADALRSVVALVREIPRPDAPEGFADAVMAGLPRTVRRPGRVLRWLVPAAAAACLLLALRLAIRPSPEGPPPQSTARRLPGDDGPDRGLVAGQSGPRDEEEADAEGAYQGDRLSEPPGQRLPLDPKPPAESSAARVEKPSPVEPGRPARAEPPADRKYLVEGKTPDATAGLILAELEHHRGICADPRPGDLVAGRSGRGAPMERVEADSAGEPAFVFLSITRTEERYLLDLLDGEAGLRLRRVNGHGKAAPAPPAGPAPPVPEAAPADPEPDGESAEAPGGGAGAGGALPPAVGAKERTRAVETRRPVIFRLAR